MNSAVSQVSNLQTPRYSLRFLRSQLSCPFWPLALLFAGCFLFATHNSLAADEKKPEKKKEPPRITVVIPLGIVPGTTNKLKIRGLNLTNATEVKLSGLKEIDCKILSRGKADMPREADAKKWGDTQLEVEVKLPDDTPAGTNSFTVVFPDGESAPQVIRIVRSVVLEKEPNGSFRQAQAIEPGKTIQGAIGEAKDVEVFSFKARAGTEIIAEVSASRYGSLLDSILTLYDQQVHILGSSDDNGETTDAVLRAKIPADGTYFLSLIDAHDRGGAPYVYHLDVRFSK